MPIPSDGPISSSLVTIKISESSHAKLQISFVSGLLREITRIVFPVLSFEFLFSVTENVDRKREHAIHIRLIFHAWPLNICSSATQKQQTMKFKDR